MFLQNTTNKKNQAGFTLIELLVAVAIFATAALVVTDIFVIATRSQRKGATLQKVQSDARLILAALSDQARQGTIHYTFYGGTVTNPASQLALLDDQDQPIIYRKSSDTFAGTVCPSAESTPCLEVSRDNGVTWAPVTSRDVKLQSLRFYIAPTTSPFPTGPDVQPRVTIALGIQSVAGRPEEQTTIFLQTTVSSRLYKR